MELSSPIGSLKGVGEELEKKLAGLGVTTVGELIENLPRRYQDYSHIIPVAKLSPGLVTIEVRFSGVTGRYVRRGMHITEAVASDQSGSVRLIWFNQPYRANQLKAGQAYYVAGEYGLRRGRFSILNPSVELVSDFPVNTARIIPVYRETKGLKSAQIRRLVKEALNHVKQLPEHLPVWVLEQNSLIGYAQAVSEMHFPSSAKSLERAKNRLGFEEVFELSLAALINKQEMSKAHALSISFDETLAKKFVAKLPFKLTNAQRRAVWQIYQDMSRAQPMNRLLEGDVGSGKTVVAAMASLMAINAGFQVALMAPTEILARQHAETLHLLLSQIGLQNKVGLLVGSLTPGRNTAARKAIKTGQTGLIVGTHALISEKVDMHTLGMVVVDEQHRFGVDQRKKLQAKAGHMPHVLHMSATPIPRSLALTLFGELDISVLDELPVGRKKVTTKLVSPNSRTSMYEDVEKQLIAGRQVFVVCPKIGQDEKNPTYSAEVVYEGLRKKYFPNRRVALLHGRMKTVDKEAVMAEFATGRHDILVSTTVIEVGVDVPNASIMIIEGAERFGLAQIHQLRGRVGRGAHQSYCYLVPSASSVATGRLQALTTISDGFKLAELDLEQRGPGAVYGTTQHGILDLRVAKLSDRQLILSARSCAEQFISRKVGLADYPRLAGKIAKLRSVTNLN